MEAKKKLPIGIEFFSDIRTKGFYYAVCEEYLGKYPVISISLKDVSGASYEAALRRMSSALRKEARRHQYLL